MKILLKLYALALVTLAAHAVLGMEQKEKEEVYAQILADAISAGDVDGVKWALSLGADVNNINRQGFTPLGSATLTKNTELLKILIDAGANVNLGRNPPIFMAIMLNRADLVKFLIEAGADVNMVEYHYGYVPLYVAAENNNKEIADLLIDAGANIAAAIKTAKDKKDNKVIKFLKKYQGQGYTAPAA